MGLREDIAAYTDDHKLIGQAPGVLGGNGIRYTAEYYLLLKRLGELRLGDIPTAVHAFSACQIVPGLYARFPSMTATDQEGLDDYVALLAFACVFVQQFAQEILEYGQTVSVRPWKWIPIQFHYWYNNTNPGLPLNSKTGKINWSAWFGRYPGLIALMHRSCDKKPPFWMHLWSVLSVAFANLRKRTDQDAYVLSYYVATSTPGRLMKAAYWLMRRRMKRYYPGGYSELLTKYFNHAHPLAVHWKD